MSRTAFGCLGLVFLTTTGCVAMRERQLLSRLSKQPAPDFELTALDGQTVRLSDFRGRPVLLAFFAHG